MLRDNEKIDKTPSSLYSDIRSSLSPYFRSARYFRSETLWREGDTNGMLVSLLEGRVKIYRIAPDGKAVTLYVMRPGDVFGFLPLIDGMPYTVNAEAMDDINAMILTHEQFIEAMKEDPRAALPLLRYLSGHLRSSFDIIMRLSSRDALSRVASALAGLLEEGDQRSNEGVIVIPVSSKEYASLLGLTPESFSRKITELADMGILERAGVNRLRIIDHKRLSSMAVPGILI
ncbi:MAG TPA: Crp/Fnr family transcriptional regulator [Spirochaetota bacterium]|nr:Crp/Fnr family transcriptional regulator [Spirochaetota bacterium]HPL17855.1 Crp/Fnr family transcriptional regulator [Spirochaetota bacterium]HQF10220.1 Crp/Fnr family transcriptional regulator [Spirochaetota bacterium]HQH99366.1 Crp/Fnr family transcriptional regulator [Spirochaetota bacterium]HQJ72954.1 Crp/Fnr family transcriptional regulator [Spirochaetota bacterium]